MQMSALELAESCGISRSYITLMENGLRLPSEKVMPKLASTLNVKNEEVLNWYLEDRRMNISKRIMTEQKQTRI
jgi:transcriptional regulator with XRE-family HTH domain